MPVTVAIANYNTRLQTRLTLSALQHYTPRSQYNLRMGDCGSTDGSLEMIMRDFHAGVIDDLEVAAAGRRHASWIDHWINTCDTPYLVLIDSDLEIRRFNWLEQMLAQAPGEAFVAAELYPDQPDYVDHRDGTRRSLGARPGVHLMLVDVALAREVSTSFEEVFEAVPQEPPFYASERGWDVGGAFMARVLESGLHYKVMDPSFKDSFRHWIGASWQSGTRRGRREDLLRNIGLRSRVLTYQLPPNKRDRVLNSLHRPHWRCPSRHSQ